MNTPAANSVSPNGADDEKELCRSCLASNEPEAPFCRQCGAPLSSYASTAPFVSLFAEGHVYRSAVERPHRPIIVLGTWLLFGCLGGTGLFTASLGLTTDGPLVALLGLFLLAVSIAIIWRTTINYFKGRRQASTPSAPVTEP